MKRTGFTAKQVQAIRDRDHNSCAWHGPICGEESLIVHHRANRGHGGRKSMNVLSNGVLLCSRLNSDVESDAVTAVLARRTGIKISSFAEPSQIPVHHAVHGFVLLGDDGSVVSALRVAS